MPRKYNCILRLIKSLFFFVALGILLFGGGLCYDAIRSGLSLCMQTIVPCLFPFLVLSRWVVSTDIPDLIASKFGRIMQVLFHCSKSSAICFILGFLGGYPVGAHTITLAYKSGKITREEAEHLLLFCNNASPAFFFGMLGVLWGSVRISLILYLTHVISAILTGFMLRPKERSVSARNINTYEPSSNNNIISGSIKSMGTICAYVLLFQIIITLAKHCLDLRKVTLVILTGILEISTGCLSLSQLENPLLSVCLASGFLSLGGICVWMQTRSIIQEAGLCGKMYLPGKALQAILSIIITATTAIVFPTCFQTVKETLYLPNHTGLMTTMLWVCGILFLLFIICCLIFRKRTGKRNIYGV